MTCFYPLHRFITGYDSNNDKVIARVVSGETKILRGTNGTIVSEYQEIPCGKCIGCRLDYAKNWANRCMLEAQQYEHNYMLTLTYDEEHVPITKTYEQIDGTVYCETTLNPRDVQLFLHKLRKHWEREYNWKKETDDKGDTIKYGFRYFLAGEYGEKSSRAHYHLIMFNFPVYDLVEIEKSHKGFPQLSSPTIEKLWGKGRISLVACNWDTCAYVARYVVKKQKGPGSADYYEQLGKLPEFVRMSRNPGIGRDYYEQHKDIIYDTDEMFLSTSKGLQVVKPAKYYDKLYDLENPEKLFEIKEQRVERAKERARQELLKTDVKAEFYNQVKETNLKKRTQALTRAF